MTVLGALGLACLFGCSADLKKTNKLLVQENEELRNQLATRNTALSDSELALREKDMELARLRESQYEQPPLAQVTGFEQIDNVEAAYGTGEITVTVASDVLFAPGKTALKTAAKRSLEQVADVLNRSYSDYLIRVTGHTDSDPIRKSGFTSNYHLGFERAYAVRDYLISRSVDAQRISLASHGPDQPRSSKAASRRVEIVVYQQ